MLQDAYGILYSGILVVLSVLIIACFIRAINGPTIADRIVAINMIGTQIIIMVGVVALMLDASYLVDVSMLYAMISFLAVVVLCKIYMGVFLERQAKAQAQQGGQEHA
ncbi:MAG TPA: monovalent cation/H+ antiporter complex subunit F [Clostridia bacterium]|jgi:multicomponent Na+:H+ antiporter subunit F|nr:monovalent cation/H+ antiporter complex subunit F [Clostridia bacterium]HPY44313.1 monovalent cation/H+ antiporter complex subunit F [Clostridia bacterium]HQA98411.1 monovalent cation/H+ antiporter complex subunit F [Clostridia bacterium]HQO56652.1 monovalent cation/H+ antiporter complex subunit F [Clostridia bacterium]HUM61158.1 monovalent cation/H+ antiporter complex subunit F [Clostridia bacterium]